MATGDSYTLAEAIATKRSSPGLFVFSSSLQLLHMNREAHELCGRINRVRLGKAAAGVPAPEVTLLCDQIAKMKILSIGAAPKDWEEKKIAHVTGDPKKPVLLTGFAIPRSRGIKDACILILMEEICLRKDPTASAAKDLYKLTAREQAVVLALVKGLTNKEIARELSITEQTTKEHIKHIMKKTKVTTRTGIMAKVLSGDHDREP